MENLGVLLNCMSVFGATTVGANDQPVTSTTCCHLSSSTTIFVLKSPVVTIPLSWHPINLTENDIYQNNKIKIK